MALCTIGCELQMGGGCSQSRHAEVTVQLSQGQQDVSKGRPQGGILMPAATPLCLSKQH